MSKNYKALSEKVIDNLPNWAKNVDSYTFLKGDIFIALSETFSPEEVIEILEENNPLVYREVAEAIIYQDLLPEIPEDTSTHHPLDSIAGTCFIHKYADKLISFSSTKDVAHFIEILEKINFEQNIDSFLETLIERKWLRSISDHLVALEYDSSTFYKLTLVKRGSLYTKDHKTIPWDTN